MTKNPRSAPTSHHLMRAREQQLAGDGGGPRYLQFHSVLTVADRLQELLRIARQATDTHNAIAHPNFGHASGHCAAIDDRHDDETDAILGVRQFHTQRPPVLLDRALPDVWTTHLDNQN